MPALETRALRDSEIEDVIKLWRACDITRPFNDPYRDIAMARSKPASEILVGLIDYMIVASVMVGHDGHRGYVYYVSTDPKLQGKGYGRQIMAAAEDWLKAQGIWKLNLIIRASNSVVQSFYEEVGYKKEELTAMSKWLDPSINTHGEHN